MAFTYQRTVRLGDTDAAGVVYFAKILSICHEAYEQSLINTGIDIKNLVSNSSTALPIVHADLDCLSPMFCGDQLLIRLQSQQLSDNEFEITYQIYATSDSQKSLAKATTRHVCINPATRRRISLSESMLHWLERFENQQ